MLIFIKNLAITTGQKNKSSYPRKHIFNIITKAHGAKKKKDPKCFPGGSDGKEPTCIRPTFNPWVRKIPWRREWLPTPLFLSGLPCSSGGKESACNVGDLGLTPGSERSSGEESGNPLQYSCLENPMNRGAWRAYSPWNCKESDTTEQLTLPLRSGF